MDSSVGYESLCLGVRHMFFYEKCGDLCSIRQDVGAMTFIVYSTRAVQALTVFRSVENSVSGRACPPFDVYGGRVQKSCPTLKTPRCINTIIHSRPSLYSFPPSSSITILIWRGILSIHAWICSCGTSSQQLSHDCIPCGRLFGAPFRVVLLFIYG